MYYKKVCGIKKKWRYNKKKTNAKIRQKFKDQFRNKSAFDLK